MTRYDSVTVSGTECERRGLGVRLDWNSCPVSALSALHHGDSQQAVHTHSWEVCSSEQRDYDECTIAFIVMCLSVAHLLEHSSYAII
jgi:hypothetical protein